MNWDVPQGKWKQMTGKMKTQWGKLFTDDDLQVVGGKKDRTARQTQEPLRLQEGRSGKSKPDEFLSRMI